MKKDERKPQLALTLLVAGIIFAIMIITVLFATIIGIFLVKTGVISVLDESVLSPVKVIALMSTTSLVLGALTSIIASKYPLKPINKIIAQINRLASGDFKARLQFTGPLAKHPTIIEVTDSFNKMAEELDNTEILRSDFINNFSHEFKTPIVSIAGFAKLLKRGNLTEEQKESYINVIEEESLRLSALATNILNMTKIESQMILTDVTEFNLSEQLRNSILALEAKWLKKNINFNLDFAEYMIFANKDSLRQVWLNLIDNAIKFSPEGETVKVSITETEDTLLVSVHNLGSEVLPEQEKRIFNKFYQADESHTSEGNGIGLALVKSVVTLHKGKVTVHSQNNETVFTVELPKEQ